MACADGVSADTALGSATYKLNATNRAAWGYVMQMGCCVGCLQLCSNFGLHSQKLLDDLVGLEILLHSWLQLALHPRGRHQLIVLVALQILVF